MGTAGIGQHQQAPEIGTTEQERSESAPEAPTNTTQTMKYMTAKYKGTCAATGRAIRRGEEIAYDPTTRKAYLKGHEPKTEGESSDGRMIRDMEDEAADRWYQQTYGGY